MNQNNNTFPVQPQSFNTNTLPIQTQSFNTNLLPIQQQSFNTNLLPVQPDNQSQAVNVINQGANYFNNNIADRILNDPQFKNSVMSSIRIVTADGKIDAYDVPELILMAINIYNNLSKFNVEYEDFEVVMTDVIFKLLDQQNLIRPDQRQNIHKLIRMTMKIAMVNVKVIKKKCTSCWGKLISK
jgi:hypothetical protein